jgi:hypothetical protein
MLVGRRGLLLIKKRDIRFGEAEGKIVALSSHASLLGPVCVNDSRAWQIRCQSFVLGGIDRVPKSSGR